MIRNIGLDDKKIRVLFSMIIALIAIIFQIWWLFVITAILFITAFVGFCPLYTLIGKNTNKTPVVLSEKIKPVKKTAVKTVKSKAKKTN